MDIGEILFLLLFFLLPLLEKLFSGRKRKAPPEVEEGHGAEEMERRTGAPSGPPIRVEPAGGWGDWTVLTEPAAEGGAEEHYGVDEEVADEEAARELADLQERLGEERVERVPEAVRVTVPVLSMESLAVVPPVEHTRAGRRAVAETVIPPTAPRPRGRLAARLAARDELRRAVILAEVLGPPKGLS